MERRTRRPSVSEWLEDELDEAPRRRTRSRRRHEDEDEGDDRLDAITSAISMLEQRLDGASQKNAKSRPGRRAQRDDHDLSDVISQITGQQDALDYQFEGQNTANIQKMQNQIRDLRSVVEAATRGSSFPGMGNDIHALQQHLQQQINTPHAQQNPNFASSIEQQMLALQQRLGLQPPQNFGYQIPQPAPQGYAPQAYAPQPVNPQQAYAPQAYAQPQAEADHTSHLPVPSRAQQVTVLEPTSASIEALRREVQTLRNTLRPSDPRALQVIEAEVRGLNKRLGSNGLGTASRDIAEMKTQITTLSRAVNEGGFHANNRFASTQLQQLNESISRVQRPVLPDRLVQDIRSDLAEATRKLVPLSVHDARSLEKNINFLAERLDSLRARSPDNARLQALEGQLGRLSTQLTQSEQTLSSLQRMESSMQEISMRLSTSAHAPGIAGFDAKSAGVMRGFQKQIEDVKAATEASDKRMHQALTSLQDVMVKVAEKSSAPAKPQQQPKRAMVDFGQREQVAQPKNAMTAAREAAARAIDTDEQIARHTPRLPPEELPMPKSVTQDKAVKAVADSFAAATKQQKNKDKTKLAALDLHADAAIRSLQDYENEPKGKIIQFRHFKRYASQIALAAAGVVLVIGVYNMLGPLLSGEQTAVASVSDLPEAKKTTPGFGFPIAKPDLKAVPKIQSASLDPKIDAKSLNLKLPAFPATLNNKTLKDAAQNGDVRAFYEIGSRLIDGRYGVQRDIGQGLEWLQLAADKQHAPALYRIGAVYEKGQGIARNIPQAIANYEAAGRLGNRKALHNLGALYASGVNGEPDFAKAFPLFKQAAELGLVDSQYNLAIVYVNGMGVKQDLIEAYKWLAIAAQNGDKESGKKRDEIGGRFDGKTLVKAKLAAQTFKAKAFDEPANEDIIPASTYADASTPPSNISALPEGASGLGGLSGLSDTTTSAKR